MGEVCHDRAVIARTLEVQLGVGVARAERAARVALAVGPRGNLGQLWVAAPTFDPEEIEKGRFLPRIVSHTSPRGRAAAGVGESAELRGLERSVEFADLL